MFDDEKYHLVMYSLKKFIPVIRKAEQCSENIVEDIYQAGKRCMITWGKRTLLKLICVTEENVYKLFKRKIFYYSKLICICQR